MKKIIAAMLCAVSVVFVIPVFGAFAEPGEKDPPPDEESGYVYTGLGNKVKKADEELTRKYEHGITMEQEQIRARKERVAELGLEKYVDKDFFLDKSYYNRYSVSELEQKGLTLLIRCMTEEDIAAWEKRLRSGEKPRMITKGNDLISWTNSAGITTRTYAFDVDGHMAFCGDHGLTAPPTGTAHSAYITVGNEKVNRILYYGYGGPEDQMTKLGYSRAKSYVMMSMCVSNLRHGQALGANGSIFWEVIKDKTPPSVGSGYYVETYESNLQDLFFYMMPRKGKLQVSKKSLSMEITDENGCYTLTGAEYGVYTNANGVSGYIDTLEIGKNGMSQEIELDDGTYYVRETKCPEGFALDETIHKVTVTAGKTTSEELGETPQINPVDILLEKVDAETKTAKPQGAATLAGAQFTVRFYPEKWDKKTDPADSGKVPKRTWVFQTDKNGICRYADTYKVSGDKLFQSESGVYGLPLGTVTIQETRASEGYQINPVIHILKITSDGTEETVRTYEKPVIPENILKLNLIKRQEKTEIVIPGAVFEHVKPNGTKEVLRTDADGELTLKGLQYGKHELRETSVMDGYEINGNIIRFTVAEDNTVVLTSELSEEKGSVKFTVTEDGNIAVDVGDRLAPFSLLIHKINDKKTKLDGAEFTLYKDKECKTVLTKGVTADGGLLRIGDLENGKKYYLKETKAPKGYRLPADMFGKPPVYEIYAESTPADDRFIFYVNGTAYTEESPKDGVFTVGGTKKLREVSMTIENKMGRLLPETGSAQMIWIVLASVFSFGAAVICFRKGKEGRIL